MIFFLSFTLANNKLFPTALLYYFLSFVFSFMCRISSTPNRFVKQTICVCFCSTHAHTHTHIHSFDLYKSACIESFKCILYTMNNIYATMMRTTKECDRDAWLLLCFFFFFLLLLFCLHSAATLTHIHMHTYSFERHANVHNQLYAVLACHLTLSVFYKICRDYQHHNTF